MLIVKCSLMRFGRDTESDTEIELDAISVVGFCSGKATLPFGGLRPGVMLSLASVAFM